MGNQEEYRAMLKQFCLGTAIVVGAGAIGNGLFMLVAPANWYFAVPGVTTTGPFNQHFLRDIGLIFVLLGAAMLAGAVRPALRVPLWTGAAIWLAGHALFHLWEVAVGICGASALARDFPTVTLPALIVAALAIWAASDRRISEERR
jgi:hypothetical protein